jgi:hypothetical protein
MSAIIKDGSGTGLTAKVGISNRLHTHSMSTPHTVVALEDGNAFNVSSELVVLTTDSESTMLYIKNNESFDISIITEFVNIGASTGGSGEGLVKFTLNPTGGTIISDAILAQTLNRRVGDSTTISLDAYKGSEGKTISGGSNIQLPSTGGAINSEYIIPKGSSFALSYTPPTSNTSIQVQIGFLVIKDNSQYTVS